MKKARITQILSVMLAAVLFIPGCGSAGSGAEDTSPATGETSGQDQAQAGEEKTEEAGTKDGAVYPLTVTDSMGIAVTIEAEPERVISLTPANTEILFALGAGDRVVGRTDYCTYPPEAAGIESIGNYWTPNAELIISKDPDVIFAEYMEDSVRQQIEAAGASVFLYSANSIEETEEQILLMGEILNLNDEAKSLTDSMEAELQEIQDAVSSVAEPKSLFPDLGDYYSAGPGSLIDDVLNRINVINIAAEGGSAWPQMSLEVIVEKNPDIYLSMRPTPEELKTMTGIGSLDCIQNGEIIYIEENSPDSELIARPGPRIVEGVRLLAEEIYPDAFQ